MRKIVLPALSACVLFAPSAMGNDGSDLLSNPGFEDPNPAMPNLPIGWNGFNVSAADYVDINDPGAEVRSGSRSIRLRPATDDSTRFQGWTTNIFRPDGSDLFDPDYEYLGGDVEVSGYYLVPEGEVIQDTIVGVKLEFRREPPNFSIWGAFEFALPSDSTGGSWMPFSFVVTDEMIEAVGDFPPDPTSVSVLPFRFFGDAFGPGTSPTGTVYFDDLCIVQGATPCPADFTEDGALDIFDVFAFLDAFNASDPAADFTGDGSFDIFDVFAFLDAFNAGCP
jgi:hypothetical protein